MRVVFDLDGTLVDSSADLLAAINCVLRAHHLPESGRSENLRHAGLGVEAMFRATIEERAPTWREDEKRAMLDAMGELYNKDPVTLTRPFDGIGEMLGALARKGIELCVISNKPSPLSRRILTTLFPSISFKEVFGPDSGYPPKPDPVSLFRCRQGLAEGNLLIYVGDTEIDHQTAHGTADCVYLASWGYRGRDALLSMGFDERIIVDKPMDLVPILYAKGGMT